MAQTLALFDFDGTLTTGDTLGDLIRFTHGTLRASYGALVLAPTLLGYALGQINNQQAKQRVLAHFFQGWSMDKMQQAGTDYCKQRLPQILRPAGIAQLRWHQQQGHVVAIVSASAEPWIKPWAESMRLHLIASRLEVQNGLITGNLSGANCYGMEKVKRIHADFNLEAYRDIYAYGDTPGDKPMLALANHPSYRPFR